MKTLHYVLALMIMFLCISCSSKSAGHKLNAHIQKVEREYSNYSTTDWEQANLEFEKLVAQVEANYDNMTQEERDDLMRAIGRYYGLVAKQGLQEAARETQKALEALPALIEGFSGAFNE